MFFKNSAIVAHIYPNCSGSLCVFLLLRARMTSYNFSIFFFLVLDFQPDKIVEKNLTPKTATITCVHYRTYIVREFNNILQWCTRAQIRRPVVNHRASTDTTDRPTGSQWHNIRLRYPLTSASHYVFTSNLCSFSSKIKFFK